MPETTERFEELTEHSANWRSDDLRVDREQRVVHNVVLAGRVSKNGYEYSEQALQQAVALYESKPVFLDHAPAGRRPQERSTRDLVGTIFNVRFHEGRIKGDIRLLDTESGRTFLALAESETPSVGMSHVVMASRTADRTVVDSIREVVSVDAVVFPATTTSLRENEHDDLSRELVELIAERDELKSERDRWKAIAEELRSRQQKIHSRVQIEKEIQTLLKESALPSHAITKQLLSELRQADDTDARLALITERVELMKQLRVHFPTSSERKTDSTDFDDSAFISSIRRSC